MKQIFTLFLSLFFISAFAAKPKHQFIRIKTDKGECIIMLYNATPKHRDNFVKLTKKGFFNGTLFHRVINAFMIQGGDPDSRNATAGKELGNGDVGYTIPAEFSDSLFHQKGALGAAREDNPAKASSGCQFYIVQGKTFSDAKLDTMEMKRLHFKIPAWQREVYKKTGGSPHLDRNYTVFGQVIEGMNLIDSIAVVPTDTNDRPKTDVKMEVSLLKRRAAKKMEKKYNLKIAA